MASRGGHVKPKQPNNQSAGPNKSGASLFISATVASCALMERIIKRSRGFQTDRGVCAGHRQFQIDDESGLRCRSCVLLLPPALFLIQLSVAMRCFHTIFRLAVSRCVPLHLNHLQRVASFQGTHDAIQMGQSRKTRSCSWALIFSHFL